MGDNKGENGTKRKKKKTQAAIHKPIHTSPVPEKTLAKLGQMGTLQQPALIEDETEKIPYIPLPKFQSSRMISQEALTSITVTVWDTSPEYFIPHYMRQDEHRINRAIKLEHFCAPVVLPVSGETISKYQTLARYPVTKGTWTTAWGKEWGNLAQGDEKNKHSRNRITLRDDTQRYPENSK